MRKELKQAVSTLAKAVRQTENMFGMPDGDSRTCYHAVEYYDQMKELLLEQLLTDCDDPLERDEILRTNDLDNLIEDLHLKADEWNQE